MTGKKETVSVCFVCLGNICRSPLAEGVFQELVNREGLEDRILISSAGTGGWHVGQPPDSRMRRTAREKGVRLSGRAEQFQPSDYHRFDMVIAMDGSNQSVLEQIAPHPSSNEKLYLFRSFDPHNKGDMDVPDPYYGGDKGFEDVFQIIARTCPNILGYLKTKYSLTP